MRFIHRLWVCRGSTDLARYNGNILLLSGIGPGCVPPGTQGGQTPALRVVWQTETVPSSCVVSSLRMFEVRL